MILTEEFKRQQTRSDPESSMSVTEGRRTSTYVVYSTSTLAVTVNPSGSSALSGSSSISTSSYRAPAAAIAGGVIGGIILTLVSSMILALLFRSRKRRQESKELPLQDNKSIFYLPGTFIVPAFGTNSAQVDEEKTDRSVETGGHARKQSEVSLLAEPPAALMSDFVPPSSKMAPARPIRGSVSLSSLCPSRSEQSIYPLLGSSASSDELMHSHDPFGAYAPVSIIPPRSIPRSSSRSTLGF